MRQSLSERNREIYCAGFEREVLISERGGAAILCDGHHDESQIEIVLGAVGEFDRSIHAAAVNSWRPKPFECQACGDLGLQIFLDAVRRMG